MENSQNTQKDQPAYTSLVHDLESVCSRLRQLRLVPGDVKSEGLIDAVLADPSCHQRLLERLAAHGDNARAVIQEIARAANDIAFGDPDNGYPSLAGSEDEEMPGSDSGPSSGSDSESESETDTDDEDRLGSDLEEAIEGEDTHKERKKLRALIRAGKTPAYIKEILGNIHEERDEEEKLIAAEEKADLMEEEADMLAWADTALEEAQEALIELRSGSLKCGSEQDPDGYSSEESAGDPEDFEALLGLSAPLVVGPPEGPGKPSKAEAVDAEAELMETEELIEELEALHDDRTELAHAIKDALSLYSELRPRVSSASGASTLEALKGHDAVCAEASKLEYKEAGPEQLRETLHQVRQAVAAVKDAADDAAPSAAWQDRMALQEIRREQRSTARVIEPKAFERLTREIMQDYNTDMDIEPAAVNALQEAAEAYLVGLLGDAGLAAIHGDRTYLEPRDIQFVRHVRGERS